jgi:hypothetical protein
MSASALTQGHRPRTSALDLVNDVCSSDIYIDVVKAHKDVSEYTFVAPERQNELTRRIQKRFGGCNRAGCGCDADDRRNN